MPASGTFIIAGGGLAGAKTAEALREQGFDGRIVLAAEEDIRPYERPPLSKDYLQGKAQRDTIFVPACTASTASTCGSVAEITTSGGKATGARLTDGTRIGADAVIVGIGAVPQTQLAGLDVRGGVVTDASLRTSDPAISAAGDIASAFHPLLGTHIRVEHWAKDVAPSAELRTWYQHDPAKFGEFRRRYTAELAEPGAREALSRIRTLAEDRRVTLLTATKDLNLSQAAVLAGLLRETT